MQTPRSTLGRLGSLFEFGAGRSFAEPLFKIMRSRYFTWGALLFALVFWIVFFWFGYNFTTQYGD